MIFLNVFLTCANISVFIKFWHLGIPTLVILDEQRKTITTQGRGAVNGDPEGNEFPWYPKPLNKLTGATAGHINDNPSVVLFTGKKIYCQNLSTGEKIVLQSWVLAFIICSYFTLQVIVPANTSILKIMQ